MNNELCQDLRPAFFCSEAVLIAKNEDVAKYLNDAKNKYPGDIQFDKVHVSVDQEDDPRIMKFLVAYGTEATFIAFRGARDFEDLGRDTERLLTSRDLHATVSELVASFLDPDFKLLGELCRSGKRIIFCGHRLGGAVAQMVISRFWKESKMNSTESAENPDSLTAISFGAPQIWDSRTVQAFNHDPALKKRFLNVSNDEDPLRSLLKDGLQGPREKSPTPGIQVSGRSVGIFCARSYRVPGRSVYTWNRTMFRKCYESAVEDVLAQANFPDRNANAYQPPPEIVVLSPGPQVNSASRKTSDSGSVITIRGSNLLFLRGKVKLDALHAWDTLVQTDEILCIHSPGKTRPKAIKNSVSKVVIKTAFGQTAHDVSEGNADEESNEEPLRWLSRVVQTYYMLATPGPFFCPAPDEVLDVLDSVVQCVTDPNKDDEKRLSTLLTGRELRSDNIEEMNALVQKVIDFLDSSYEIHFNKSSSENWALAIGGIMIGTGLVLIPLGCAALAAVGASLFGVSMATIGLTAAAAGGTKVMGIFLNPKVLMLERYSDMLLVAIYEASLWNPSASYLGPRPLPPGSASPPTLLFTNLESSLQQEVERSGSEIDRMMDLVNSSKCKDIRLGARSILKDATLESKRNLLKRMHIVVKTVELYKKKVKNMEFLGVVGEEDAGKSTFIKKVIESVGAAADSGVPLVGIDYHTEDVTPYKIRDQFYMVDFPGSNGTHKYADSWLQFTALPSSCILLLDFRSDIKKEQVSTYKQMKERLGSNIVVVFNKVDQQFTQRLEEVYGAEYFENHRMKSAEHLGCDGKDVHYVCLDPDPEERLPKLRKVGVLGFEELAYKLGEWLDEHSVSESHRVLRDCLKTLETTGNSGAG